ncbi:MAG: IS1634 family transposase, partial [Elusimicrobia bacterium]|nr:IS1634 family transposase [Elusimicrobiota bacterium]
MLYDLTSTYFEGEAKRNPQARRGHSRDHRPDCKQICVGLAVSTEGYPLGYEVFAGNTHDIYTVKPMIETMEKRWGKAGRIWVMDRGMVSDDVLAWMRAGGRRYLVATHKSELKKYEALLKTPEGWQRLKNGVELCRATGPAAPSNDTVLLVKSEDR